MPVIDVASAIDGEAVNVTLTRRATGSYNADGDFTEGAPSTSTIRAAVQPATGRQREDLPEGIRNKAEWLMWSRVELIGGDVIGYAGRSLEIVHVWPRLQDGFWKAALGEAS